METFFTISEVVCNYYGLSFELIRSKSQKLEKVKAMHIIWYFSRIYTTLSLRELGRLCGKEVRNCHCDVIHAVKSVNNQLDTNRSYRIEVESLRSIIEQRLFPEKKIKNFFHYSVMSMSC